MPRTPRLKASEPTFYHLYNHVAGDPTFFPFRSRRVARKFLQIFTRYLRLYACHLASFQLMWNHFHAVLFFEAFRRLTRHELQQRARLRFGPRWQLLTQHWSSAHWEQFNHDLFDLSCFMHHVNGEFAKWFNRRFHRRGPFWADRFKNTRLLGLQAVQDALLYTELNAVRAGRLQRPEADRMSSAYWRWAHPKSHLLIPLEQLFPPAPGQDAFTTYRALLYHRGAVATKNHQAVIPHSLLRQEQTRGFARPGAFRRRLSFFTRGRALGPHFRIQQLLHHCQQQGLYRRRQHPIPQLNGLCFSLIQPRSPAFAPG